MIYDLEFAVLETPLNLGADVLKSPQTARPGRRAWDKHAGKCPFSLKFAHPQKLSFQPGAKQMGKTETVWVYWKIIDYSYRPLVKRIL